VASLEACLLWCSAGILAERAAPGPQAPRLAGVAEQIEFLRKCRPGSLLPLRECIRAEIGRESTMLQAEQLEESFHGVTRGGPVLADLRAQFRRNKGEWRADAGRLHAVLPRNPEGRSELHRLGKDWEQRLPSRVEAGCRQLMRMNAKDWGLPPDEAMWPDPNEIPSLWAFEAYHATRWCLTFQKGWKLDPNDSADGQHFICAAHADILVSHDDRFLAIARACPPPRPEPMHFVEWARGILGGE
jgi:hypothetical protein